jgi:carboxymethylenebutenolidase
MYENDDPVHQLVHLYVDGAFGRRELMKRVARYTGSMAAAAAALGGFEELKAQPSPCPANIRVPVDAEDLVVQDVEFSGEGGKIFGHFAYPKNLTEQQPGIIVIHENRGLVDHIKDVTRRAARAGFVALGVDLLSRQGGTQTFTEPTQQTAAYGRTTQEQRRADLLAGLDFLKFNEHVVYDRIGIVGFCAGGANVWDFIVNVPETAAAVPFYGAPPVIEDLQKIQTPVQAMYAETDRALTLRMAPVMTEMITRQKTFGLNIYQGVGHAFHNDTGAAYNAEAACDAWARTVAFWNKHLRRPRE